MAEDHLSNEVSISAELTPSGVKAGAKSRLISAVDRIAGGIVDLVNVPLERAAQKGRAKTAIETKFIEALGERRLEMLHSNPEFVVQAIEQNFKTVIRRQENKIAVVNAALEDLRDRPPTEQQNANPQENLSDDFTTRFERYAEDASTDQLREKWGRVLASEIRSPGSIIPRAMRIIDELAPETAAIFERLFALGTGDFIIRHLAGELSFQERQLLVSSELIDPPTGQVKLSVEGTEGLDVPVWLIGIGAWAISIPRSLNVGSLGHDHKSALIQHEDKPVVPIYSLTPAGTAIASILPTDPSTLAMNTARAISQQLGDIKIAVLKPDSGNQFIAVAVFRSGMQVVS